MGLREAVLLGFVLLFTCGNLKCFASQNETLNQIPQEAEAEVETMSLQPQTTAHQSNLTEQTHPVRGPVSYRLRTHQLRNSAVDKQMKTFLTPQSLEDVTLTSELQEHQELIKLPIQGPNLKPRALQETKVQVKLQQRVPVQADSVAVSCGEAEVNVQVKQNFLGNGQLIRPSDLTLGGCAALDTTDHILLFQTELQSCGSIMSMTEDALVYSFSLMYTPTPIGSTFILKTNPAEVIIECHYQRRHYVSSSAVRPVWTPFASDMLAEQRLRFSLRLMTEDWQSQRPSSVYVLSDVMHIEAAVLQSHHVPLRVYVDSCVATTSPDPESQPRNSFINNHGCFTEGKMTAAKSYFMQKSQEDKLQFLLKVFRFHQDHRSSLYITCHLKATTVSAPIDSQHKACSYLSEAKRWVASGGDNKVCSCCESSCREQRWKRSLAAADHQWEGTASLDLTVLDSFPPEPVSQLQTPGDVTAPSTALLGGVGAALALVLLLFIVGVTCSRLRKPTKHDVCT